MALYIDHIQISLSTEHVAINASTKGHRRLVCFHFPNKDEEEYMQLYQTLYEYHLALERGIKLNLALVQQVTIILNSTKIPSH
jgi:hypothetical protein